MIQANELMIGNYLFKHGEVVKIVEIGIKHKGDTNYYLRSENDNCGYWIDQFKPIPLTEEWLLKFGFEQKDHLFRLHLVNSIYIEYNSESNLYYFDIYMNTCRVELQYLHELQNIYQSITFKELNIEL